MTEPYLGEIRLFGGNFAPVRWQLCNGSLLQVQDWPDLAAVLGNVYGGDGVTTFGVPDLRGRVPIGIGNSGAKNATTYSIGATGGAAMVALTAGTMPAHNHALNTSSAPADTSSPEQALYAAIGPQVSNAIEYIDQVTLNAFSSAAITSAGGTDAHENRMPSLPITFIISLAGKFPVPAS